MNALMTGQIRLEAVPLAQTGDLFTVNVSLSGATYHVGLVRKTKKGFSVVGGACGYKTMEEAAKSLLMNYVSTYDIKHTDY